MKTKLTLTIDKKVIERAKLRSRREKKSISQLVEDFLNNVENTDDENYKLKAFEKHIKKVKESAPEKDLSKATMKKLLLNRLIEKYG
jgi:hypothetical protein